MHPHDASLNQLFSDVIFRLKLCLSCCVRTAVLAKDWEGLFSDLSCLVEDSLEPHRAIEPHRALYKAETITYTLPIQFDIKRDESYGP